MIFLTVNELLPCIRGKKGALLWSGTNIYENVYFALWMLHEALIDNAI